MDFLNNLYLKSAAENENHLRFWEDYLNNLKALNLESFSDKLTVPVLVPIGNKILFRGELKHTNEVTVSLGADYFAKCSIKQAEILKQHRIKDAQAKVDMFRKERDYLNSKMSFSKENVYDNVGKEIVESYSEEEDKEWRKRHKENVRNYRIQSKTKQLSKDDMTEEDLWDRLDELELQEELANELFKGNDQQKSDISNTTSFVMKEEDILKTPNDNEKSSNSVDSIETSNQVSQDEKPTTNSKLDLLQKVIDRQNELEEKLQELKYKEKNQSRTEEDLLSRLNEMEQLDELEDEMYRLDGIIESEDVEYSETDNNLKSPAIKVKKSVSFADEDDSETLEITFKHSEISSSTEPYNAKQGIQKPSDIYEAFGNLFTAEATSILKKSRYDSNKTDESFNENEHPVLLEPEVDVNEDNLNITKTIVMSDVKERVEQSSYVEVSKSRPTSLFKKKRMLNKS